MNIWVRHDGIRISLMVPIKGRAHKTYTDAYATHTLSIKIQWYMGTKRIVGSVIGVYNIQK